MTSEQMVSQCRLRQNNTTMVSWLDTKKKLKVGSLVSLKGLDGLWEIESIGRPTLAKNIKHDWHNNY